MLGAKLAASGPGQKPLFMNEAFETETCREETGAGHTLLPGPAESGKTVSGLQVPTPLLWVWKGLWLSPPLLEGAPVCLSPLLPELPSVK